MAKVTYALTFVSSRILEPDELWIFARKLTRLVQHEPLGEWRPEMPDPPHIENVAFFLESDPLLGYNKRWLVDALLDHLTLTRIRLEDAEPTIDALQNLKFALSRVDEFAGSEVPDFEDLREIATQVIT